MAGGDVFGGGGRAHVGDDGVVALRFLLQLRLQLLDFLHHLADVQRTAL